MPTINQRRRNGMLQKILALQTGCGMSEPNSREGCSMSTRHRRRADETCLSQVRMTLFILDDEFLLSFFLDKNSYGMPSDSAAAEKYPAAAPKS